MESNGISTENQVKLTKESCPSNNLSSDHILNGFSNGINSKSNSHHKHKHKNKDKDKDREKHRDKHKHKDKEKDRDQEKHRHDEKEKQKSNDESKKEKSERKEKEHRSKEKDDQHHKEKNHSTSEKEKELKDKSKEHHKDKHKSSSKDKDHKTSSSSSKHSSGDKHHSSSKDKEKHKDKHKHSKHSSSDKSSVAKHSTDNKEKQNDKVNDSSVIEREQDTKLDEKVDIKEEPVEDFSDNNSTVNSQSDLADDKDELRMTIKKEPSNQMNSFGERDFENEVEDDSMLSFGGVSEEETALLKTEEESEDDIPLNQRSSFSSVKRKIKQEDEEEDSEEDIPLMARKKIKQEKNEKKRKAIYSDDENSDDYEKKKKPKPKKIKKEPKNESLTETPTKKKKTEEEQEVWRWWEEEKKDDGVKWNFLEHKGPMFAPPYEPLPSDIKFYYEGKEMKLSQDAEEIATFYAKLIEHEYTTKEAFNKNFFKDWRKSMTPKEKEIITDLKKCDFRKIHAYFLQKSEERKAMSKEEKKKIKEENEEIIKIYGFCIVDGHKEKIGNFKIEPPGLFRGRGEHPKMGMLKRRVVPEDVIINCSKDSKVPDPPAGHKWKDVRHDNTVTWLASWTENVQGQVKYVMLNPSSKLKGEKDWQKYETARKLAKCVDKIRREYREDWKSKEMRIRQRAVAMYFIDKLALRAGNEKDEDQADTVGCCSLRVEHIQLHEEKDGKNYVVVFDFLGKDSIRYYNEVPVEKRVFKNLQLFVERKTGNDDLFDRLNTAVLNKHLNELMEGLTAKVFRTYNASITLQNQLIELTDPNATVPEKILQYNRANRAVAILCNHQRSIPKSHEKSMGNLKQKIDAKKEQIQIAMRQYKDAKREAKDNSSHSKMVLEKKKKALERLKEQLVKLEVQETDKEENKTIALGTSKLNYLDPRISVAWCKKHNVPIEKIYNKTQRSKFRWAIDMAGPEYIF